MRFYFVFATVVLGCLQLMAFSRGVIIYTPEESLNNLFHDKFRGPMEDIPDSFYYVDIAQEYHNFKNDVDDVFDVSFVTYEGREACQIPDIYKKYYDKLYRGASFIKNGDFISGIPEILDVIEFIETDNETSIDSLMENGGEFLLNAYLWRCFGYLEPLYRYRIEQEELREKSPFEFFQYFFRAYGSICRYGDIIEYYRGMKGDWIIDTSFSSERTWSNWINNPDDLEWILRQFNGNRSFYGKSSRLDSLHWPNWENDWRSHVDNAHKSRDLYADIGFIYASYSATLGFMNTRELDNVKANIYRKGVLDKNSAICSNRNHYSIFRKFLKYEGGSEMLCGNFDTALLKTAEVLELYCPWERKSSSYIDDYLTYLDRILEKIRLQHLLMENLYDDDDKNIVQETIETLCRFFIDKAACLSDVQLLPYHGVLYEKVLSALDLPDGSTKAYNYITNIPIDSLINMTKQFSYDDYFTIGNLKELKKEIGRIWVTPSYTNLEAYSYAVIFLSKYNIGVSMPMDAFFFNQTYSNSLYNNMEFGRTHIRNLMRRALKYVNYNEMINDRETQEYIESHEDSFEKENAVLRELYESQLLFNDCVTGWVGIDEIQDSLMAGECSIEFIEAKHYEDGEDKSDIYALLLKKDQWRVRGVRLCEMRALMEVDVTDLATLCELIWLPLRDELEGIEKVYFTLPEELELLPVESALYNSTELKNKPLKCFRLSTTAKLASRGTSKERTNSMLLVGGINFDDDLSKDAENLISSQRGAYRYSFDYLPASKREVESISRLALSNGYMCNILDGLNATEDTIKAMNLSNFDIIHLSTHGFNFTSFKNSGNYTSRRHTGELFKHIGQHFSSRDARLWQNGVALSGSNHVLMGDDTSRDLNDGILTAYEIQNLDLSNVDLVVMATCSSGIDGGANNFGLESGLRNAGAKSIMKTLWNIDDDATQIFMLKFYECLLGGATKIESLKRAQSFVRDYNKIDKDCDYSSPAYWAPFVLVDALE